MNKKNEDTRIQLIEDALLQNIAGGLRSEEECGPGDCTNHGGCGGEEEEEDSRSRL